MASYDLSWDEAVDIPDEIAGRLLYHAAERENHEREDLAIKIANNIGKMLFGDKMKTGGKGYSYGKEDRSGKRKTAYWSGGKTSTKPDLHPNPSRPRLKELQEMEPQSIDPFALSKMMSIDQSKAGVRILKKPPGGQ